MAVPGEVKELRSWAQTLECVSGLWALVPGLGRRFRGMGISLSAQSAGLLLGDQWSVFPCSSVVALESLALGGALIRSFILAASFPEGKGTASIIYSIWSKRKW